MKRFFIIALLASISFAAMAQPRAAGLRFGTTGLEASYQHSFGWDYFLEGEMGLDFGAGVKAPVGFKAIATYNIIWARPAWTNRGSWSLYAGPGLTLGYVNDNLHYRIGSEVIPYNDNGFMLALAVQVGLEYNFDFPLTLAAEVRPAFGMHANGEVTIAGQNYSKVGFYDNGMLGFVPTVAVRYKF